MSPVFSTMDPVLLMTIIILWAAEETIVGVAVEAQAVRSEISL